ncbi:unnamed protein product [Hyaloperonospora brassicae]|uniref:WLM domain-containing protein n=1 Tax=Hyaloperonospora brassicae TaxID=162125 RepID=A0AAV0U560_HYABA|nr:unnamed protein product [Hyaloperonospora brassicae]
MTTLTLTYKGQTHCLSFSDTPQPTIADLQLQIERITGVRCDAQRLFQERRRIDCSNGSSLLAEMCQCQTDAAPPLLLVEGASMSQIHDMKAAQEAEQKKAATRDNRTIVNIAKRNKWLHARDTAARSEYGFQALEPLPQFADKEKARALLQTLANDRGLLAVMAEHKWNVGVLAEMPATGKVGVDPVCVLGLNQNKGQKILLRLRTDDLLGFRKYLSIKKVLFHELSHMVYSEHDSNFYQLMRQIEKECNELDWTSSGGAATGGSRIMSYDEEDSSEGSHSGHRLGGYAAGASRLPDSALIEPKPAVSTSESKRQLPKQAKVPANKEPGTPTMAVGGDATKDDTVATLAEHEKTIDEEVATLAMSDRERRIHDAVRRLRVHYSTDAVSNAVALLHKIVSNIVTRPADGKFRSIRKANRLFDTQVAKFPECLEFLLALGFEDQADKFVLVREDPALLWIGLSSLEVLLSEA